MALTNEIFELTISGIANLNSPTSYDGRCAWFTTGTSNMSIHIIEFWGPYQSEDNDHYLRWAEPALDTLTFGQNYNLGPDFNVIGPKLKEVKVITTTKVIKYLVRKEPGFTTAICSDGTNLKISETTYEIVSSVVLTKPAPVAPLVPNQWMVPFQDEFGVVFTGNAKWLINSSVSRNYQETPHFYFTVNPAPCEQNGLDQQKLYWYDLISGAYVGHAIIPGRKQQSVRYIAYLAGYVFVGAFNEGCVYVYHSVDGSFVTTLSINRDVDEMFVYQGVLYVSSRNGLFTKILDTLAISDYGNQETRDFYIALLNASYSTPSIVSDEVFYDLDKDAIGHYDGGATLWKLKSINSVMNAVYFRRDTRTGKQLPLANDQSIVYVPSFTYNYFVNGSLTAVTVPAHLLTCSVNLIKAIRLPYIYNGAFSKSFGGVMAISTGPLHYKGDAI